MKTGGTQVSVPKATNTSRFKAGDYLKCTSSTSCGYTVGKVYQVFESDSGYKCLMADDGLEDPLSLLLSTFVKVDKETCDNTQRSHLTVVS